MLVISKHRFKWIARQAARRTPGAVVSGPHGLFRDPFNPWRIQHRWWVSR